MAEQLNKKQDLIFRIFTALIGKQELGTVGAGEVEQMMQIAELAADKILAVKA